MSVPVRAIVVDDSASNEGLLFEELRRGGFEPELRRVTSREEMEEALVDGGWDVVLSDLNATHLGAFEAIALLKERDIDVPFLAAMTWATRNCSAFRDRGTLSRLVMKRTMPRRPVARK